MADHPNACWSALIRAREVEAKKAHVIVHA
jgi:hypothetical protein